MTIQQQAHHDIMMEEDMKCFQKLDRIIISMDEKKLPKPIKKCNLVKLIKLLRRVSGG